MWPNRRRPSSCAPSNFSALKLHRSCVTVMPRFEHEETERTEFLGFVSVSFAPVEFIGWLRKNQSAYAISDLHLVEIDQQPERHIKQLHVAQELGLMDRKNFFHGFCLNRHAPLNQHIKPQRLFLRESFVLDQD